MIFLQDRLGVHLGKAGIGIPVAISRECDTYLDRPVRPGVVYELHAKRELAVTLVFQVTVPVTDWTSFRASKLDR